MYQETATGPSPVQFPCTLSLDPQSELIIGDLPGLGSPQDVGNKGFPCICNLLLSKQTLLKKLTGNFFYYN
jgi:hypothetical protein